MIINFDRQKYLTLAQSQGYPAALTALHKDMERWEYQTFEGAKGYQPQAWEDLKEVRAFSRDLMDMAIGALPINQAAT